ncbi:VOC family protein [Nocardia suismassiliense]|uniref:VOC family protein n=1 Tax=Nocardia suismassiliense TaxID=2077092 RepID=UPI000D1F8F65|nr:VOC family protein [Nocardia suismassiliense]
MTLSDVGLPIPLVFFRVGIVVPDLDAAIARFADGLGIRFTDPVTQRIPLMEVGDRATRSFELTTAMSRTEPPYYELIQATGDGIFAEPATKRVLYYGCWEQDTERRLAGLASRGAPPDVVWRPAPDTAPTAIFTRPDRTGGRIGYLSAQTRPAIEEWVRTGKSP